jgi:hypothetical protein
MRGTMYMDIQDFWKATISQDEAEMRGYLSNDATIRWHNTNEEFTAEEFIRANCEYPGKWNGEIERIEKLNDLIITVNHIFSADGSPSFHVTSFIRIKDHRIISIDEYWGDDGRAPEWRLKKNIGRKIR